MAVQYRDFFGQIVALSALPTTTVTGGPGDEPVLGTDGADLLIGGGGGRILVGGLGDDTYRIQSPNDQVVEGAGAGVDTVQVSGLKRFTLADHVENLFVTTKMSVTANDLDNLIVGDKNPQIFVGGAGNDVISGKGGADTFIFTPGSGYDVLTDFNGAQMDRVRVSDYGFHTLGEVTAAMTQVGADVVLQLSPTDAIKFLNKTIAGFQPSDFQLAYDAANLRLSFHDDFSGPLSFYDPASGSGVWNTNFSTGAQSGPREYTSHTLHNNDEQQIYVDPLFAGVGAAPLGLDPFSVDDGVLTITATATTDAEKQDLWFYNYQSGLLTTAKSFSQTYGYYEIRAQLPLGDGLWPAFWLLPASFASPPELDVVEQIGGTTAYFTSHSAVNGVNGGVAFVPDIDSQFHTYGVMWTNKDLLWYLDGKLAYAMATPADMDVPMYLLLNLAVGGNFPGDPDPSLASASMQIDYIHAYSIHASDGEDGDLAVTMDRSTVGATSKDAVGFKLTGLDEGARAVITFTDSLHAKVQVKAAGNGAWTADLSSLANGVITTSVAATEMNGEVAVGVAESLVIDPNADTGLTLSAPIAIGAGLKTHAAFTVAGIDPGRTATVTFTDSLFNTVQVTATADGVITADLTGLADGVIKGSLTQTDDAGAVLYGVKTKFNLDSTADQLGDLALSVAPVVNAQAATRLSFEILGLDRDAIAVVTFTDAAGHTAVVKANCNSAPFVNLAGLTDGPVTVSAAVLDDVGNTARSAPVTFTLDTTADGGEPLAFVGLPAAVDAYAKSYVPIALGGLDADATATATFTDSTGRTLSVDVPAAGGARVNLGGLEPGAIRVVVVATDAVGNVRQVEGALDLAPGVLELLDHSHVVIAGTAGGPMTGSAEDDLFVAGPGPDVIDGAAGSDTVSYDGAAAAVKVSIAPGGQKTLGSGIDRLTGVENLVGSAFGDTLKGDAAANVLLGADGSDSLKGMEGDDLLGGGAGDDTLTGGAGIDTASYFDARSGVAVDLGLTVAQDTGGAGNDKLSGIENLVGSRFGDRLLGSSHANQLDGGAGDDVLVGGRGADILVGGDGADLFTFGALVETKVTAPDRIVDFSAAEHDRIDLSQIDASKQTLADDAFTLVDQFTRSAGQLIQTASGDGYLVQGDVNGDGVADFALLVEHHARLLASDFIL